MSLRVDFDSAGELASGLADIRLEYPERFAHEGGMPVQFIRRDSGIGLRVAPSEGAGGESGALVEYREPADAFRALGILMGSLLSHGTIPTRHEDPHFQTATVMIDVSRNAVLKPEAVASLVRRLALMGITGLMLYMEDTYEVPGEPYFGHARGRYSPEELRQIDDAAHRVGIEVVPCIQVLGHLENVLKWPAYHHLRDNDRVLLADEPSTYELVDKMISAVSGPLRSSKIHLGMDEAWGLGGGMHQNRYGPEPPLDIFSRHLERVVKTCLDLGLEPMIWSDMYFRLTSPVNSHHDLSSPVPADVASRIPPEVRLVYWDYDHVDESHYARQIKRHRTLGREPLYAGAALTWLHFWAQNPASFKTLEAGMSAARSAGLDDVIITLWGDDSNECDHFSALPAIQGFAEAAYTGEVQSSELAANFRGSCDATLSSWLKASDIDIPDAANEAATRAGGLLHQGNPGKWQLWSDPVLDLVDISLVGATSQHYSQLASHLQTMAADGLPGDDRLWFVVELARTLALKVDLHARLRPAYARKDVISIQELIDVTLPAIQSQVERLHKAHHDRWRRVNKIFGWEVIDRRYGGLAARLDTLRTVLTSWVDDPSQPIEALEIEQLPSFISDDPLGRSLRYATIVSGCRLGS